MERSIAPPPSYGRIGKHSLGKADVIVTTNLRHFPATVLATHGMTAQLPGQFVHGPIAADIDSAAQAFAADRARKANPRKSVDEYLGAQQASGLVVTAAALLGQTALL